MGEIKRFIWTPYQFKIQQFSSIQVTVWRNKTVLTKDNFDVSFMFYPPTNSLYDYQTYFQYLSVNISQVDYTITSSTYLEKVTQIPVEICREDRFDHMSETIQDLGVTNNAHCLDKNFNIVVKGSYASNEGSLLRFTIQKCIQSRLDHLYPGQGMNCKSDQEIEEFLPMLNMDTTFLKQYFEEKDFDTPIKSTLYNQQHTLQGDIFTYKTYYLTKNYVELEDSYISSSLNNQNLTYNQLTQESTSQRKIRPEDNGVIMDLTFFMSDKQETTKRQVTTLIDAISNIGGFMTIVLAAVKLLIGGMQQRLFYQSIVKRLYLTEKDEMSQYDQKTKVSIQP
eukprot:403350725